MFNSEYELIDEVLQLINDILSILDFDVQVDHQNIDILHSHKIYIEIINILFPFLQYNLIQIDRKSDAPADKIENIVKLLERDIIKRDISHIRGKDIAKGDMTHVYNLVVVLYELTKRHVGQAQEQEDQDYEQQEQDQAQDNIDAEEHRQEGESERYSPGQPQSKREEYQQHSQSNQAHNYDYFTRNQQKEAQNDEEQSSNNDEESKRRKVQTLKRYENIIHNNQLIEKESQKLKLNSRNKNNTHSNQDDNSENYDDVLQRKLIDAHHINSTSSKQLESHKRIASTAVKKKKAQGAGQLLANKHTLKKHLERQLFSPQPTKKTLTTQANKSNYNTASTKALKSPTAKEFSEMAYASVRNVRQKIRSLSPDLSMKDKVAEEALARKKNELKLVCKEQKKLKRTKVRQTQEVESLKAKNEQKKMRALQLQKQENKKRSEDEQQAIIMKLRDQKCRYIKKMQINQPNIKKYFQTLRNTLIEKLEKNKYLDDRKQFKQKLVSENKETAAKFEALENYHRTQMDALRERQHADRAERKVIQVAHKDIIQRLQRELKNQSKEKMIRLQDRFKEEYYSLQQMENIEEEIIRLYKKY